MDLSLLPQISELYRNGGNIIEFLKKAHGRTSNTLEDIIISYDFQSGSYIKYVKENFSYSEAYTNKIVEVLSKLGNFSSILEVGVGEATTLRGIVAKLKNDNLKIYGLDIAWSRIYYALQYLKEFSFNANLFIADLFNIPLGDSSIDIVYTSHSLEPNGGREKEAIKELYRVAKKYVVLFEPANEFANEEGKERMKKHGYVQNLVNVINELGYELIEYRRFEVYANPLNPTGLYVIKKENNGIEIRKEDDFYCPVSKKILKEYDDHYYSKDSFISYPKILGIPCLWSQYGILTSKHE